MEKGTRGRIGGTKTAGESRGKSKVGRSTYQLVGGGERKANKGKID